MENPKDKNKNDDKDCENKINLNDNNDENKEKNNEDDEYNFLKDNKILGRFTFSQKLYIINKLNVIVYNRIKKELMIELKRKRLENKILMIKSRIKTKLILQKKMQSLVQQKMIRDFNFKKN